jgi:phenylalanyl-tRNA synthetase alpha chain
MVRLRKNEKRTLLVLKGISGKGSVDQIVEISGLAHSAVMRAALALSKKKNVIINEQKQTYVELNSEGKSYARTELPERKLIMTLTQLGGKAPLDTIRENAGLGEKAFRIGLGWLHRKNWVMEDEERILRAINIPSKGIDEELISIIDEKDVVIVEDLKSDLHKAVLMLKRRKLLNVEEKVSRELELMSAGWELLKKGLETSEEISKLTPELIRTRKWREIDLRRFDLEVPGPIAYPGKIHPVKRIIQRVKEIFIEMGFTEIRGPIVETAFWNFDALFQPQDHPARDMQDTFYLENPSHGKLPKEEILNAVGKTHENGWKTGSSGWGYEWSRREARSLVLRTHTTAATIRYLAKHKKPPRKVFSVDRVYRNEKLDYKHLAEFHQIEGIIMDKNVTLRDLMGTLKEFYMKLGLEKVQFWPSYFPYTEPSVQSTVYVPEHKAWVELCGMGMFRPEVLAPLGIKNPVLAWGGGLERLIMLELGVDDIRLLYKNDLNWIRRTPICR